MRSDEPKPGSDPGRASGSLAWFPPFLAFLLLSFLLYGNTLSNAFVYDDKPMVSWNRLIRELNNLPRIFASGYWTMGQTQVPELYRPLLVVSYALNYFLNGANPFGYHVVNILLHGWVCWLVYRLARVLSGSHTVAWVCGLLFAVHPVHAEAVAPVVGRSETLAAGFFISALLLDRLSKRVSAKKFPVVLWAVLCYLVALLSKENAVVLPAVLLLTDLSFPGADEAPPRWRRRILDYGLYLLVTGLYFAVRFAVLGAVVRVATSPILNPLLSANFGTRALMALVFAGKYVGLLLWPLHLSADYTQAQIPLITGLRDPRLVASFILLGGGAFLVIWSWRRFRIVAWSVLFGALTLLPVSNLLIPIPATIFAEHYLYLPSLGFCILVGLGFVAIRRWLGVPAYLLLGMALALACLKTVSRNRIWHDDGSFAVATAADAPKSYNAQHNLAIYLEHNGDLEGAEKAYRRAVEILPNLAGAHAVLANLLFRRGRAEEAIAEYRQAIALRPLVDFRVHLGNVLYRSGRYEEAAAEFRIATKAEPGNASYHHDLARSLEATGDFETAVAEYRAALSIRPNAPLTLRDLGLLLARRGERGEAAELLRRAATLIPGGLDPASRRVLEDLR